MKIFPLLLFHFNINYNFFFFFFFWEETINNIWYNTLSIESYNLLIYRKPQGRVQKMSHLHVNFLVLIKIH